MTKNNEIVKKEEVMDLASFKIDSSLQAQVLADSEGYDDGMGADELEIPRIKIVQALTKEVIKSSPKYIEGLDAGDTLNTLTKEIVKGGEPLYFVPSIRKISYIEFSQDNKLINHFGSDSSVYDATAENDKGKRITASGSEIQKTQENFIQVIDIKNGTSMPALFSARMYKMKAFNSTIRFSKVVEYAKVFKLVTKAESKDDNYWFGFDISVVNDTLALPFGKEIYDSAKKFNESFSDTKINIDYNDEEESSSDDDRV
ncbi:MAG: hypothetical protein ACJASR_000139 [Psychroserpens sp.]|jgi:hypothetical protein